MRRSARDQHPPVGIVGLGFMGQGIAACLLAHGLELTAYERDASRARAARSHIGKALRELTRRGLAAAETIDGWRDRLRLAASIERLAPCRFVIETVAEDLAAKREVYDALERCLARSAVIASNTSAIPITALQEGRKYSRRFVGMHWGEPAEILRYLEIVPGEHTSRKAVTAAEQLGLSCGKDPTVLRFDIPGFISNRLMYAMIREAFHLVETGVASIETVDRSFRNDIGWWAALAGPFRWMDLTGIPAYAAVMETLLPALSNRTDVPDLMRRKVRQRAQGVANAKGFYSYRDGEAARWSKEWVEFTYDMRELLDRHSRRLGR